MQPLMIPVLGDQLSHGLASLAGVDRADCVVLMMEVRGETAHIKHHRAKIALTFAAMRHFAAELRAAGWTVDYVALDDPDNRGTFSAEVARAAKRHRPRAIRLVEPSEWRMEFFYREMRRKTGLLMTGDKPEGGRWNFDAENRSGPPPGG